MKKNRKWQTILIVGVLCLTIYNILPTLFYYFQPLHEPVSAKQSEDIRLQIQNRVNQLEKNSQEWLESFCSLIHVRPKSISLDPQNPKEITLSFNQKQEADLFRKFLPRAGALIPFAPAQLMLSSNIDNDKDVIVERNIESHLDPSFFSYISKNSKEYETFLLNRAAHLLFALTKTSKEAENLQRFEEKNPTALFPIVSYLILCEDLFSSDPVLAERFAARLTQGTFKDKKTSLQTLIQGIDQARDALKSDKQKESNSAIEAQEQILVKAKNILKKREAFFLKGKEPWDLETIQSLLKQQKSLSLSEKNAVFSEITIDLAKDKIVLHPYPDITDLSVSQETTIKQPVIDELAKLSQICKESFQINQGAVEIQSTLLADCSGLILFDLEKIIQSQVDLLVKHLRSKWNPVHPDLKNSPIVTMKEYEALPPEQKALCIVITSPSIDSSSCFGINDLKSDSIYLAVKGISRIAQNYEAFPHSELRAHFSSDLMHLQELLKQTRFLNTSMIGPSSFDGVFEKPNATGTLIEATREKITTCSVPKYAFLELSNKEQRIHAENKIDTSIHEDLIKWQDEYLTASVSLNQQNHFDVPKPTKNIFLNNLKLSFSKMLRGDDQKIIRWGLDLSGGKTVEIELLDVNHNAVTDEADIKQGLNELHERINKMGVSEISLRKVGNHIVLDFPGTQALSASELIQASTMYFHIVNEQFSPSNPILGNHVDNFLQDVWNEATIKGSC